MNTGVSHHFLLCRRKYQNSATKPPALPSASSANSSLPPGGVWGFVRSGLSEITAPFGLLARNPVRRRRAIEQPLHGIVKPAHYQAHGRDHQKIRHKQDHVRDDPAKRERDPHHPQVNRANYSGRRQSGECNCRDRARDGEGRQGIVEFPEKHPRQHRSEKGKPQTGEPAEFLGGGFEVKLKQGHGVLNRSDRHSIRIAANEARCAGPPPDQDEEASFSIAGHNQFGLGAKVFPGRALTCRREQVPTV